MNDFEFTPGMGADEAFAILRLALTMDELGGLAVLPVPPDRPQLVKLSDGRPIFTVPENVENGWLYRLAELQIAEAERD
jgi:hypothetical protein